MPKAPINGIELYYESHGDGPAVVFAHGRGGNHMSWWQQVPVISRNYRCITFDHRGWGQSSAPLDSIGPTAFVEDLKQLLDYLQVPQTFLVSQSMGGLACLNFALDASGAIPRLGPRGHYGRRWGPNGVGDTEGR